MLGDMIRKHLAFRGGDRPAPRLFSALYRRLGKYYPAAFLTVELQSAFLITLGAVALASFYYEASRADFLAILAIACGLTAIGIVFVLGRVYGRLRPVARWIAGDRTPEATNAAWLTAVSLPLELVLRDLVVPILVVVVPTSVAAVVIFELSPLAVLPLLFSGLIAMGYSGILHYLAVEAAMRPVLIDLNAHLEEPLTHRQRALPLRTRLLATLPLINIITGMTVAALTSEGGGAEALGIDVLIVLFVAFTISFELTVLLSRSIVVPVEELEAATERVRRGRFDQRVPVTSADELGDLSAAFNQMVEGLAEREQLRAALGVYLDEEVARHIIEEGFEPEGHEVEVSLLFCDVWQFTEAAARAEAREIVGRLNELFECVVPIVSRHRGHVDQFIGDALLAVFGTPERLEDHADRAVECAVEIARTVNSRRPGGFRVGIGVNTGSVVAGSIGGAGRLSFSVIGDAVNVAARVEALTRETGDPVLITGETRHQLSQTIAVASRGQRDLKGFGRPIELFAPEIPLAVEVEGPGEGLAEATGGPRGVPLGRPAPGGDGLGKRTDKHGLGRPAQSSSGRSHTLPGR